MKRLRPWIILVVLITLTLLAFRLFSWFSNLRSQAFMQWARGDEPIRAELITVQKDACPGAPFILPTEGFIGLLYADPSSPYSSAAPHQGIDIFSNALEPGPT